MQQFLEIELPDGEKMRVDADEVTLHRTNNRDVLVDEVYVSIKVNKILWPRWEREIALRFNNREHGQAGEP